MDLVFAKPISLALFPLFHAFYRDKSARLSGASATLLCQGQFIQLDTPAEAFDRPPSKTGTKAFQEKKRKKVTGV